MPECHFNPVAISAEQRETVLDHEIQRWDFEKFIVLGLEVANLSQGVLKIDRVRLFDIDLGVNVLEVFRQGFFMPSDFSRFAVLKSGEPGPPSDTYWKYNHLGKRQFLSHGMTVYSPEKSLCKKLLGFTTFRDFEGYFIYDLTKPTIHLQAYCELEGWQLAPGESLKMERLFMGDFPDFADALDEYAVHTGKANNARIPGKVVTGWGDWQYYRMNKTEGDILTNLSVLKEMKESGYPLEYIIIDDGFFGEKGWLEPNDKFPSGIKYLSGKVREAGFKFGLWFNPYCTESVNSDLSKEHPEWMVKNRETGELEVGFRTHILDYSLPGPREWLRNIVRFFVKEWKVEYLKLDGPRISIFDNAVFAKPNFTSVQLVALTLKIIREECGEECLVEGEGLYGPAIGLVDTQRITQDNFTWWYMAPPPDKLKTACGNGLRENLINDLLGSFIHNRFWHNHRENVVLRDFYSPFHPIKEQNPVSIEPLFSENELTAQISAFAMSGGAMLLTDPMDRLKRSPGRYSLISKFLPHYDSRCIPLDTFNGGSQPSLYYKPIDTEYEKWHVAAAFNWEDDTRDFPLEINRFADTGEYHAFDFWNREYLGCFANSMTIKNVPPHGCKVLALRKNLDHPQVVGSSLHIFQGAAEFKKWSFDNNVLHISIDHFCRQDEQLFIRVPESFSMQFIETTAENYLADARDPYILIISYNGNGKTEFQIRFTRNKES